VIKSWYNPYPNGLVDSGVCSGNLIAKPERSFMTHPSHRIVVMAFSRTDGGEIVSAFDAAKFDSEERALRSADELAGKDVGVIAWSREAARYW
jgi:hypothetical protein